MVALEPKKCSESEQKCVGRSKMNTGGQSLCRKKEERERKGGQRKERREKEIGKARGRKERKRERERNKERKRKEG